MVNKAVFQVYGFRYPTLLTALHFGVTGLGLYVASLLGLFHRKPVRWAQIMPLSVSYAVCTPLSNLSLLFNSVGFYQLAKLAFIPYLMAVQSAFHGMSFSDGVKASVVPLTAGIAIASAGEAEVSFSLPGLLCAVGAIVATARYQIQVGTLTKELGLNNLQLVLNMMPGATIVVACLAPLVDGLSLSADRGGDADDGDALEAASFFAMCAAVALSAVTAFGVNVTTFLLIGNTSPLTYNIVGFVKTLLVLVLGVVFWSTPATSKNLLGTAVALSGLALYMRQKLRERDGVRPDAAMTLLWRVAQAAIVLCSLSGVFLLASAPPPCTNVDGAEL